MVDVRALRIAGHMGDRAYCCQSFFSAPDTAHSTGNFRSEEQRTGSYTPRMMCVGVVPDATFHVRASLSPKGLYRRRGQQIPTREEVRAHASSCGLGSSSFLVISLAS